jgi:hypothetical protein
MIFIFENFIFTNCFYTDLESGSTYIWENLTARSNNSIALKESLKDSCAIWKPIFFIRSSLSSERV